VNGGVTSVSIAIGFERRPFRVVYSAEKMTLLNSLQEFTESEHTPSVIDLPCSGFSKLIQGTVADEVPAIRSSSAGTNVLGWNNPLMH
jgi:hypothetical protein